MTNVGWCTQSLPASHSERRRGGQTSFRLRAQCPCPDSGSANRPKLPLELAKLSNPALRAGVLHDHLVATSIVVSVHYQMRDHIHGTAML